MKKTLIISLIGFFIIIVFSIFIQNYLQISSNKLVKKIEDLQILMDNDEIEEGLIIREELKDEWGETKKKWSALIDHNELDNIEETLRRIEVLIGKEEEKAELLSELNKVKFYLEHIPERESFVLENVL